MEHRGHKERRMSTDIHTWTLLARCFLVTTAQVHHLLGSSNSLARRVLVYIYNYIYVSLYEIILYIRTCSLLELPDVASGFEVHPVSVHACTMRFCHCLWPWLLFVLPATFSLCQDSFESAERLHENGCFARQILSCDCPPANDLSRSGGVGSGN